MSAPAVTVDQPTDLVTQSVQADQPKTDTPESPTLTQAQLNKILADERRKWEDKATRDRERAEEAARIAEAEAKGELQKVNDSLKGRVTELEAETARIETLTHERDEAWSVVDELVASELKDAPAYVAEALDGKSAVDKLRYVQKHKASWQSTPRGTGPTPPPANGGQWEAERSRDAKERTTRFYRDSS